MAVLPHRPPFLFLQEVTRCTETQADAYFTFTDEAFFQGHFPEYPVVPGVILLEGLAQTLAYLALRRAGPGVVLLTGVDSCKIRRSVSPGQRVDYSVHVTRTRLKMVVAHGSVHVGEHLILKAELRGIIEPQ
jgi:3-hydroxyacyl-[acyl-carrier-protein] dehydratase